MTFTPFLPLGDSVMKTIERRLGKSMEYDANSFPTRGGGDIWTHIFRKDPPPPPRCVTLATAKMDSNTGVGVTHAGSDLSRGIRNLSGDKDKDGEGTCGGTCVE